MKRFAFAALALVAYLPLANTAHAQHVSSGIIAEYNFNEGSGTTVGDSGPGAALDLTIRDAGNVTWGAGYLSVDTSTVLDSLGAATKIIDAVALGGAPTNEISIEAYIRPGNNEQGGAARIVNLGVFNDAASDGPFNRNFFLAQDKTNYDARLRTTDTGTNGSSPQQQTDGNDPIGAAPELQHVMFTRDVAGNSFIYVDGVVLSNPATVQTGDFSNWDATYGLTIANEKDYSDASQRDFLGEFHHVTIYSRALSAAEVAQNAESFGVNVIPEPTSLVLAGLAVGLFGAAGRRRKLA